MDALILCGGFAKRLEPLTLFVPKPLLPIGGKPLIDYIVDDVEKSGVNRVIVSTNKKFANQFAYWRDNKMASDPKHNIELVVEPTVHDGHKFGAIRGIEYAIEQTGLDDDLLIISGDNFYNFSLDAMLAYFREKRNPTICAHDIGSEDEAKRFGVIKMEDNVVVEFEEKPAEPKSTIVSTGIYVMPKEIVSQSSEHNTFKEYLKGGNSPDAPGYFMQWLVKNLEVHAIVYREEWFDIGTIDTYSKVFSKYQSNET
jgi:glucose-1-phosphate thymidylyltransferase